MAGKSRAAGTKRRARPPADGAKGPGSSDREATASKPKKRGRPPRQPQHTPKAAASKAAAAKAAEAQAQRKGLSGDALVLSLIGYGKKAGRRATDGIVFAPYVPTASQPSCDHETLDGYFPLPDLIKEQKQMKALARESAKKEKKRALRHAPAQPQAEAKPRVPKQAEAAASLFLAQLLAEPTPKPNPDPKAFCRSVGTQVELEKQADFHDNSCVQTLAEGDDGPAGGSEGLTAAVKRLHKALVIPYSQDREAPRSPWLTGWGGLKEFSMLTVLGELLEAPDALEMLEKGVLKCDRYRHRVMGKASRFLKEGRLPETEAEWAEVGSALQQLVGCTGLPASTGQNTLSAMKAAQTQLADRLNSNVKDQCSQKNCSSLKEASGKQEMTIVTDADFVPDRPVRNRKPSSQGLESSAAQLLAEKDLASRPSRDNSRGGAKGVLAPASAAAGRSRDGSRQLEEESDTQVINKEGDSAKLRRRPSRSTLTADGGPHGPLSDSEAPVEKQRAGKRGAISSQKDEAEKGAVKNRKVGATSESIIGRRVPKKTEGSKSCHQCMCQHIYQECRTCLEAAEKKRRPGSKPAEGLSFCNNCLESHYPMYTRADCWERCFRCRNVCVCKACLRKMGNYQAPEWSAGQQVQYAIYTLGCLKPHLDSLLDQQRLEETLAPAGKPKPSQLPAGQRVTCDRCATSISDVYRCCRDCSAEFCMACCREIRTNAPLGSLGGPANVAAPAGPPEADPWPQAPDGLMPSSTAGVLQCPECQSHDLELRQFHPTLRPILEAVPRALEALAPATSSDIWLGPGEAINPSQCGGVAFPSDVPGVDAGAPHPEPVDQEVKARLKGPWRECALLPEAESVPVSIFCPTKALLALDAPGRHHALSLFQEQWRHGRPMIVRECQTGRLPWLPGVMTRACRERNLSHGAADAEEFLIIDCSNWTAGVMTEQAFFSGYKNNDGGHMLKVKDFPAEGLFKERLRRHYADFLEQLGCLLPEYTHPEAGPLNLGCKLPPGNLPPDLGPKTYIAYGRQEEKGEGDNVTKLHLDLSDAVNILAHVHCEDGESPAEGRVGAGKHVQPPEYGGAGAVWDIFRREDTPVLMRFLEDNKAEFFHSNFEEDEDGTLRNVHRVDLTQMDIKHVIHCQKFMLTQKHLKKLEEEYHVQPWHFEQYQDEAVFIPAGCAHQVRNLKSCTKVAVDFISPESMGECLKLCNDYRAMKLEDKLQARLHLMVSSTSALEKLVELGRLSADDIGQEAFGLLEQRLKSKQMAQQGKGKAAAPPSSRQRKPRKARLPRGGLEPDEEECGSKQQLEASAVATGTAADDRLNALEEATNATMSVRSDLDVGASHSILEPAASRDPRLHDTSLPAVSDAFDHGSRSYEDVVAPPAVTSVPRGRQQPRQPTGSGDRDPRDPHGYQTHPTVSGSQSGCGRSVENCHGSASPSPLQPMYIDHGGSDACDHVLRHQATSAPGFSQQGFTVRDLQRPGIFKPR